MLKEALEGLGYTKDPDVHYFDFGQAIHELRRGFKVARRGWNGRGMWVALQKPDEHSKMTLPYIYMSTVSGELVPWTPSGTDIFGRDWSVIDE